MPYLLTSRLLLHRYIYFLTNYSVAKTPIRGAVGEVFCLEARSGTYVPFVYKSIEILLKAERSEGGSLFFCY